MNVIAAEVGQALHVLGQASAARVALRPAEVVDDDPQRGKLSC